jgi:hypothetical protein
MKKDKNLFKIIYNFFFCMKYPFYKVHLHYNNDKVTYTTTWYDSIPEGWRIAFGKQLSKDLKKVLKKDKALRSFQLGDVKEKWGGLRIYPLTGCSDEVFELLDKYEQLSFCYCQNCGAPVRYRTKGWVSYLCETCFMKYARSKKYNSIEQISETYETCRLQKKDIPDPALVDFYKLWNIKK